MLSPIVSSSIYMFSVCAFLCEVFRISEPNSDCCTDLQNRTVDCSWIRYSSIRCRTVVCLDVLPLELEATVWLATVAWSQALKPFSLGQRCTVFSVTVDVRVIQRVALWNTILGTQDCVWISILLFLLKALFGLDSFIGGACSKFFYVSPQGSNKKSFCWVGVFFPSMILDVCVTC